MHSMENLNINEIGVTGVVLMWVIREVFQYLVKKRDTGNVNAKDFERLEHQIEKLVAGQSFVREELAVLARTLNKDK